MTIVTGAAEQAPPRGPLAPMALAALGVVYGDIGTSPLYTFKTAIAWAGGEATPAAVLGMLSLIVWTLVVTTSIKYVAIVMRADNDGEGGILALMSLLGIKHGERAGVIALGILGAALLYGDGAITPAISVLSALEGIKTPLPEFAPYVLPLSILVLIALFCLQPQGTARIGRLFGPIMTLWFVTIGALGLLGIIRHPGVLAALDPRYGLHYLFGHGLTGFLVLGGVFLCATGAEALYADMGHFGPQPIRLAWYGLVLPTLLLNYAGQAAVAVDGGVAEEANPFFMLCPPIPAGAAGGARHCGDRHREPVHHQRHVLDDAPSHPARLVPAAAHHPDVIGRLRPDLRGIRQLELDGADFGPGAHVSLIGESRFGIRHCGRVDHAADLASDVSGHARGMGLEPAAEHRGRGPVHRGRSVVCRRQHDESV
jgi:K+ potassium transporter